VTRIVAILLGGVLIASCGGKSSPTSPSTATPPVASVATVTVAPLTVTVEPSGANFIYHLKFLINETSGRSAAAVTSITLNFSNGGTATATPSTPVRIPAGQSYDPGTINSTDATGRGISSSVSVNVSFNDDAGHSGTGSGSTTIRQLQYFSLVGFVRGNGQNLANATVKVVDGPDAGKVATNSGGYYAFGALQEGTFQVQAGAPGYNFFTRSVTLSGNAQIDFDLSVPAPAVEYRITGTARRCDATYENSSHGTNQATVDVPFSYTWNSARTGDFLYMSCQISTAGDRGDITVAIYKNGVLYRSGSASGFPNIASASGSY
jgi:hypothetical protein